MEKIKYFSQGTKESDVIFSKLRTAKEQNSIPME